MNKMERHSSCFIAIRNKKQIKFYKNTIMKTLQLLVLGLLLSVATSSQAQVNLNVTIGTAPSWGPSGYDNAEYYYLPDVASYYDVQASQFIYYGNGKWIRARRLPVQYNNYDLYGGYKVVLTDYHGKTPYTHYKEHKVKYTKGYKGKPQKNIGSKYDKKVYSKKNKDNNGHGKSKH